MKIAFIGVGAMGEGMVKNLVKGGHVLTVCKRSETGLDELRSLGVSVTTRPGDAACAADVAILCLPDSDANSMVCYGPGGVLESMVPGTVLIDCGTSRYDDTIQLSKECQAKGIAFLDAPISGMPARAQSGELTMMCGGERAVFDRMRPMFACMGSTIVHMGPPGSGQLMKLINQLLYNISCAALAEILPMSVRLGLDPAQVAKVVNTGTGRSHASEYFLPLILEGDFNGGLSLARAYKDMKSAAMLAAGEQIPLPVLSAANATYQTALLRGHGALGKGAMMKVYEELLGVEFRKSKEEAERG
jgi:3-hydroxyisobutyrate dehydrogenase-like beta-hydroxyacid dehydrogenase